eukprot:7377520-Prymnesium_polylepis.2
MFDYVKAVRKRFIGVKKRIKMTNVFPPVTHKKLGDEIAIAVNKHRGSRGSKETLTGAIKNVLSHAFNEHSSCRQYFRCPSAPDADGKVSRPTSAYKDGLWLHEAGGAAGGGKLRPELEK